MILATHPMPRFATRQPPSVQFAAGGAKFCYGIATQAQLKQHLAKPGIEVAFCGRSNVGKSSLFNALCRQKQLAYTSQRPGRTMQLNVFAWQQGTQAKMPPAKAKLGLVDLPGYGFATQSYQTHRAMQNLMIQYLQQSRALLAVFVLLDARRDGLSPHDKTMLTWLAQAGQPHHLILTKADKLNPKQNRQWEDALSPYHVAHICSAKTGLGLAPLRQHIQRLWQDAQNYDRQQG